MQRHPVDLALPAWPVPEGAAVAGRHDVLRSTSKTRSYGCSICGLGALCAATAVSRLAPAADAAADPCIVHVRAIVRLATSYNKLNSGHHHSGRTTLQLYIQWNLPTIGVKSR